ncbi:MAG: hypothetical protein JWP97_3249 [Labilithrix sp.]|nr:hypothetical protein [Labilithrix sp.]
MYSNTKPFAAALALSLSSALLVAACRPAEAADPQPGSEARLERREPGESWHATTRAAIPSGNRLAWIAVEEDVRLDPAGRLVHAETRTRDGAEAQITVTLDAPSHTVVVDRGGKRETWTVPGDEPWIIAPVQGARGEKVPTPLVAWSTYRTTRDAEWVRLVLPLEKKSYVVPRDQYVVGSTVIVADQAIEVDEQFVRTIVLGGVELARGARGTGFRFHGG